MHDLKACPWCGGTSVVLYDGPGSGHPLSYRYVVCRRIWCQAHGPCADDAQEAVDRWNALPRGEPADVVVAALRLARAADGWHRHLDLYESTPTNSPDWPAIKAGDQTASNEWESALQQWRDALAGGDDLVPAADGTE